MKNKCLFLAKTSFLKKVKNKWFVVVNVLILLALLIVFNIDHVIKTFGGDFLEPTPIYILDETKYSYEILTSAIDDVNNMYQDTDNYKVTKYEKTKVELKEEIEKNKKIVGIVLTENSQNVFDALLITNEYMKTVDYQILVSALNQTKSKVAIALSDIDTNELNKISSPVTIEREYVDESKKSEDESMNMIMTTVFPFFILPFFMLTIFLIQMIGAEINDEKTTRGMEIIISNVSPKAHFISKLISSNAFVLFEGILLFIYGGLGLLVRLLLGSDKTMLPKVLSDMSVNVLGNDFMSKLLSMLPWLIILMIVTFIGYSLLAGILASVTTSTEDFQQVQMPILFLLLLGYFLAIMAGTFNGSIFIKIMSYVPFISAILSPSLFVLGQVNIISVIAAIILMLVTNYLLIHFGMKVYKEGILNYSSDHLFKKIIKSLNK